MFLFSLRNTNSFSKKLNLEYEDLVTTQSEFGEYSCTFLTDDFYSHSVSQEKLFCLYESFSPLEGISTDEEDLLSILSEELFVLSYIFCNKEKREIYVSRKFSAGRPFYYYISPDKKWFCCASHIHLLRDTGVTIVENRKVIPEFLAYRFVIPPNSLFKDIMKIEAGEQIKLSFGGSSIEIEESLKYMPPERDKSSKLQVEEIARQIGEFLENDILEISQRTDDSLVMPLSGGLDSSILTKIALKHKLIDETFSTGYPFVDEQDNTEKDYALTAANAFGTKHKYYKTTTQNYLKSIILSIAECEEPHQYLQSALFNLFFSEGLSKKGIIVSGQGADGLFGLPVHYKLHVKYGSIVNRFSNPLTRRFLKNLVELTGKCETLYSFSEGKVNPLSPESTLWTINQSGDEKWICEHFGITRNQIIQGRINIMERYRGFSLFDQITIVNLLGNVVSKSSWSKLAEIFSNKTFYPYMRRKLVDFCFSIPWDLKLIEPKFILRRVARNMKISEFIVSRPKSGMSVDKTIWAEPDGIFEPFLSLCKGDFDIEEIRKLQTGNLSSAWTFWNILNYSIWKRIVIENNPPSELFEVLY